MRRLARHGDAHYLLAGAVAIVLVWGLLAVHLAVIRHDALRDAIRANDNIARLSQTTVADRVTTIDAALRQMEASYVASPAAFNPAPWMSRLASDGLLGGVALADSSDHLLRRWSAEVSPGAPVEILCAAEFPRPIGGATQIVALVRPAWLRDLYGALDLGRGYVMLVGLNGLVRGRAPAQAAAERAPLSASPALLHRIRLSRDGALKMRGARDGIDRVISFRRLSDLPLVLVVGEESRVVFADYRRAVPFALLDGLLLTCAIIAATTLLVLQRRRERHTSQSLRDAVENISQGLMLIDADRRVPVMNARAAELLGLPPELRGPNRTFDDILAWQLRHDEFGPPGVERSYIRGYVENGGVLSYNDVYERTRPDGTMLEVRNRALADGRVVRTFTDITERRRVEERLRHMARHDGLTGLANRAALDERLAQAMAGEQEAGTGLALLLLGLDRFRSINEALGSANGDAILVETGRRLVAATFGMGMVARVDGDAFVVLQRAADQPGAAAALANRLVDDISRPFALPDGRTGRLGASVGVALAPEDGATSGELLRSAEAALGRAKAAGRGRACFAEPDIDRQLARRRAFEQDLRAALGSDELLLHYQPVVSCRSLRVVACEVLVRWQHPRLGLIQPADFIAVAEETGIIVALGEEVLLRACIEAASWRIPCRIAVNVSPAQLYHGDFDQVVAHALQESGLPPARLELELTEALISDSTKQSLRTLRALEDLGVGICIDDFGVAYSNFAKLFRMPVGRLKIDRSLIEPVAHSEEAATIVRTLLGMGRALGIAVTGEGVETQAQADLLCASGCDEMQGFLFGRPAPVERLQELLALQADAPAQA